MTKSRLVITRSPLAPGAVEGRELAGVLEGRRGRADAFQLISQGLDRQTLSTDTWTGTRDNGNYAELFVGPPAGSREWWLLRSVRGAAWNGPGGDSLINDVLPWPASGVHLRLYVPEDRDWFNVHGAADVGNKWGEISMEHELFVKPGERARCELFCDETGTAGRRLHIAVQYEITLPAEALRAQLRS